MATSKAPKHDFAPPWLKIPEQEGKPTGTKSTEHGDKSRSKDYYNNYRYNGHDYQYGPSLPRQRSFDNYYDDRRYPSQKYRHHSVDDDYYGSYNPNYGPYYGYNFEKYSNQYRSQPSLYRDGGKYQNPRYNQMNGGYPPYYDHHYGGGYDYHYETPYYNGYGRGSSGGPPNGKRNYGDRQTRNERDKVKDGKPGEKGDVNKDKLDDDFPSLNGDSEDVENKPSRPNASGVWEKPLTTKVQNCNEDNSEGSHQNGPTDGSTRDASLRSSNNMYKTLVPNKAGLSRKGAKDASKLNSVGNGPNKTPSSNNNKVPFSGTVLSRETTRQQSPSAPMEILSSRTVSTPKNLDKKSEFLKALKKESPDRDETRRSLETPAEEEKLLNGNSTDPMVNGMHNLSVSPCEHLLSSSLEAEQRLLREMGWREDEEEEYVITEDDKKEFQQLSKQIEGRNGFHKKKVLPKRWNANIPATDLQDVSSSSDDSDDDDLS